MVKLDTIEEWQRQSSLLLQARPTTTRITTKYNIPNLESAKYQRPKKRKRLLEESDPNAASTAPKVSRAVLCLKTFDPESGVCLRFKTDRAADVGRSMSGLGKLARHMAALPQQLEDTAMPDATETALSTAAETVSAPQPNGTTHEKAHPQAGGTGPGKKKKKGKK